MRRPRWSIQALLLAGDVVAVLLGSVLGRLAGRLASPPVDGQPLHLLDLLWSPEGSPHGVVLIGLWIGAMWIEGLYDPLRATHTQRTLRSVLTATLEVLVGVILAQFFLANRSASRLMLLSAVLLAGAMVGAWRLLVLALRQSVLRGWVRTEGVLTIGTGEDARLLAERLERLRLHRLVGFLAPSRHEDRVIPDERVLGGLEDLRAVVNEQEVGLVIIASRVVTRDEALELATDCGRMGLGVLQVPFTWGLVSARVESAAVGELELVRLGALSYPTFAEAAKRAFDLVAVLCGAVLLAPLLVAVAVAIRVASPGPVLYVSKRAGQGGRAFDFYKFRTMVPGADELREDLDNEADGRLFKMEGDPRITPVGAFLRRWSIDELPQLYNVLRGDMNLVGPRPLPVEDLEGIETDPEHWFWFEQRSRVKPGITGLWQVEGRSDLPFRAMVGLDVRYIQNWNLILDLQILLRTVPAVLRRRGAR